MVGLFILAFEGVDAGAILLAVLLPRQTTSVPIIDILFSLLNSVIARHGKTLNG